MHFRRISAKIQLKILKQHFDWGGPRTLGPPLLHTCYRYDNYVPTIVWLKLKWLHLHVYESIEVITITKD